LYGERIGSLHFVTHTKELANKLLSNLNFYARVIYASPPLNGSRIVHKILSDPIFRAEWMETLGQVINRMKSMRVALKNKLVEINCPPPKGLDNWDHITTQQGMFCFTGLNENQCTRLVNDFDIYLTKNGRISVSGMNTANVA